MPEIIRSPKSRATQNPLSNFMGYARYLCLAALTACATTMPAEGGLSGAPSKGRRLTGPMPNDMYQHMPADARYSGLLESIRVFRQWPDDTEELLQCAPRKECNNHNIATVSVEESDHHKYGGQDWLRACVDWTQPCLEEKPKN